MRNINKIIMTTTMALTMLSGVATAIETNGVDVKYVSGDITGLSNGTINVTGFKVSLGSLRPSNNETGDELLLTGHVEKLNDANSNESITKADIGLLIKTGDLIYGTVSIGLLSSSIGSGTYTTDDDILGGSFLKVGGGLTSSLTDDLELSAGYNRYLTFGEGMNEMDLGVKYKVINDLAISVDYTSSTGAASTVSGDRTAVGLAIQF